MGTKSVVITVSLWLSMEKTNVVSTEVLIRRKRYFLPWSLKLVHFSKTKRTSTDVLQSHIILPTSVTHSCITACICSAKSLPKGIKRINKPTPFRSILSIGGAAPDNSVWKS